MKKTTLVSAACFSALLFASSSYAQFLHLDADSIGAADGAAVTSWVPTVGSDTFTGTATYVADWNTSGHASLSFNGTSDYMSTLFTSGPDVSGMTMIVAGAWNSSVHPYYDYMTAATSDTRARIFEDRGSIGARFGDSVKAVSGTDAMGYGTPFVIAARSTSSGMDMWLSATDGSFDFDWYGSTTPSSSTTLPGLVLAANGGLSEFSDVNIAEVLIYEGSLGSAEIHPIVDGLVAKYTAVPEPSTFALFMGGLGVLMVRRFRRA